MMPDFYGALLSPSSLFVPLSARLFTPLRQYCGFVLRHTVRPVRECRPVRGVQISLGGREGVDPLLVILIIVLVLILLGGGGYYGRGRWW